MHWELPKRRIHNTLGVTLAKDSKCIGVTLAKDSNCIAGYLSEGFKMHWEFP